MVFWNLNIFNFVLSFQSNDHFVLRNAMSAEHSAVLSAVNGSNWDFLMFTQIWPSSICAAANEEKSGSCLVPSTVAGWTIHGLW